MKMPKILLAAAMGLAATLYAEKPVLKIAYSDWPGWTAWEIADKKGFFKKHGIVDGFKLVTRELRKEPENG